MWMGSKIIFNLIVLFGVSERMMSMDEWLGQLSADTWPVFIHQQKFSDILTPVWLISKKKKKKKMSAHS